MLSPSLQLGLFEAGLEVSPRLQRSMLGMLPVSPQLELLCTHLTSAHISSSAHTQLPRAVSSQGPNS